MSGDVGTRQIARLCRHDGERSSPCSKCRISSRMIVLITSVPDAFADMVGNDPAKIDQMMQAGRTPQVRPAT